MMSNTDTMPLMMALRIAPMPFTMAIRHAPIDWNTALTCFGGENTFLAKSVVIEMEVKDWWENRSWSGN